MALARKPLLAATMPVLGAPVAESVSSPAVVQMVSSAAPDAILDVEPIPAGTSCQPSVDLKAFTGRGEPRSVRLAAKAVDDIHARMRELALASMKVGKNVLYLTVHARLTNQHSLRWRGIAQVGGRTRHKHLTWDEAAERIRLHPYDALVRLQVWDAEARELNEIEQAARAKHRGLRASHQLESGRQA